MKHSELAAWQTKLNEELEDNTTHVIDEIRVNLPLLKQQRDFLVAMANATKTAHFVDGLINMLDFMIDKCEDQN